MTTAATGAKIGDNLDDAGTDTDSSKELDYNASKVLQDLHRFLTPTRTDDDVDGGLFDKSVSAVPVAAIKTLLCVVERSTAETMMGLQEELKTAASIMLSSNNNSSSVTPKQQQRQHCNIALQSGIELFLCYITRFFVEAPGSFVETRRNVLHRGQQFELMSLAARDRIAAVGCEFIQSSKTILIHGWSRVVAAILAKAAETKQFDVYVLAGQPDAAGVKAAQEYATHTSIPVTVIPDTAMMRYMEDVDMVLVGADGVVENGGIVNKLGTAALAACAQCVGVPVYVAAESYKFARLYPLRQSDIPDEDDEEESLKKLQFVDTATTTGKEESQQELHPIPLHASIKIKNPTVDFTPAKFITLLFTDLGVLTPAAVSDELIRLYQ